MKRIVNLIDDARPGGIRSLLDDMTSAGVFPADGWLIRTVNPVLPIRLDGEYDVIVVHYSMAWRKLPALLCLRRRYPDARLVIVEHHYARSFENEHVPNRRRFRRMLRRSYALANHVVAVSKAQASWLRSMDVVDAAKLATIPACRDYSRFLAIPRTKETGDPLVVGALGRLEHAKGFDVLIQALAELPADRFRLRIAGDGSQREELERLAAGLEHVEFVGHLDDPAPFLAACDVLAMPSRYEAFGLVCAEAKAAGLPVVVSDVDALPDQARGCGVVVQPDNVFALRVALDYIAEPSRMRRYGRYARGSVVNAWADFLRSWQALLA